MRPLLPAPPGSTGEPVSPEAVTTPETTQNESAPDPPSAAPAPAPPPKRHHYSWAHQLKRSLHVNALVCSKCARGPPTLLRVLAFLSDPAVVVKILDHLRLPSSAPTLAPARMPEDEFPFQDTEFAGDDFEQPVPVAYRTAQVHPIPSIFQENGRPPARVTPSKNPTFSQSLFFDICLTLGDSTLRRPKRG
jgi:hypothetical protein